jgi:hypothetical protein
MAIAFARAAREAEAKGLIYGVELEHRPDNPHDPNAIAVIGIAERKGWFKRTVDRWHIDDALDPTTQHRYWPPEVRQNRSTD